MSEKVIPKKLLMPTSKKQPSKEKEQPFREEKKKKALERTNKHVIKKEACEFLKFIKHSEYSVVEQLNKIPARISLLSLFQSSETHCNALLKALSEAYVAPTISIDGIDQLVESITVSACIALHISIKCKSHIVPRALLDNGSSLNVMLMSTLSRLPIDLSDMRKSQMVV